MYSVTIVWSAFAFIHFRLVHPCFHTCIVTLPLVLLNVLLSSKTHWQSTVAPEYVLLFHSDSLPFFVIAHPIYTDIVHYKDALLSWRWSRQVFILIDVLSWTHVHNVYHRLQCKCGQVGGCSYFYFYFLRWQQGSLKASFTVYKIQ